jgi:hypothetical protein
VGTADMAYRAAIWCAGTAELANARIGPGARTAQVAGWMIIASQASPNRPTPARWGVWRLFCLNATGRWWLTRPTTVIGSDIAAWSAGARAIVEPTAST